VTAGVLFITAVFGRVSAQEAEPVSIGSRLELFVDDYLIGSMNGAALKLHEPQRAQGDFYLDRPWEGEYCGYTTVFKDGDLYRMYYLGWPADTDAAYTCYAESRDGIHWTRPNLGIFEVHGTRENNVILAGLPECHNFSPFLDAKPGVPAEERYKAVGGLPPAGLVAYCSEDGVHWRKMREEPIITMGAFAFDSHNIAFYSEAEACYVCYFRVWADGVRSIARCTSQDFLTWTDPVQMDFGDTPWEHLYTNSTTPYFRAPHIYIALPSRFMHGRDAVTQEQKQAAGVTDMYMPVGAGFNDMPLMTSRGGNTYQRTFLETFIPPGPGIKNWTSRANYPACGIVPTPDSDTLMSMYVNKDTGYKSAHIARYVLRYDGFISVNAPYAGGEMVTKPLTFTGSKLLINYATSAPGYVKVEIQDAAGQPVAGYTLEDADEIVGDEIERAVSWKGNTDVGALAGKPVRLRFVMKAADLYSVRFAH
jgi:hypothetical protein